MLHEDTQAARAALVVSECRAVAQAGGSSAARSVLWREVVRDPWLLANRPVLGALRRVHGLSRDMTGWRQERQEPRTIETVLAEIDALPNEWHKQGTVTSE